MAEACRSPAYVVARLSCSRPASLARRGRSPETGQVHSAECVILTGWAEKARTARRRGVGSQRGRPQRRAVQQRAAERRVRDLRFRLLSARDASAAAGRLMDAFAGRDRVSCAYDAEATVSAVAGRMAQAGFAGDQLRDACLDISDALAASSAPLAAGILRAFTVAGPDSAVRDHARILADAAGRTAPACCAGTPTWSGGGGPTGWSRMHRDASRRNHDAGHATDGISLTPLRSHNQRVTLPQPCQHRGPHKHPALTVTRAVREIRPLLAARG